MGWFAVAEIWTEAEAATELARLEQKKRRTAVEERRLKLLRDAFDPETCARLAQWFAAAEYSPACSGKGAPVRDPHFEMVRRRLIEEAQGLTKI